VVARLILLRGEEATERGLDAERGKEVGGDAPTIEVGRGSALDRERIIPETIRREVGKGGNLGRKR
jgi:hypothetical protein